MSLASDPLPTDPDALRAFAATLQAELARRDIEIAAHAAEIHAKTLHIEKLKMQLAKLRRARFGQSSEKLDHDIEQLELLIGMAGPAPQSADIRGACRCPSICLVKSSPTIRSVFALAVGAPCSAASGRMSVMCWNTSRPASRSFSIFAPS